MNDREKESFQIVFRFYEKWREITIDTDQQWLAFVEDVGLLAADLSSVPCPLGQHLMEAVLDSINETCRCWLFREG